MLTSYDIDTAAEREGRAVEQFCGWFDQPPPMPGHVALAIQVEEAIALGLNPFPPRNRGHFQRQPALRAFDRVLAGGKGKTEIVTRADKERRRRKRAERVARVLKLSSRAHAMPPVTVAEAAELIGYAPRTLCKAVQFGHVPYVRLDGRIRIDAPGLAAHFRRKLKLREPVPAGGVAC